MPPTCMPVPPLAVLAMGPVVMSPLLAHFTAAEVPPMVVPVICPAIPASMTSVPAGSSASNEIETLLVTLSITDSVGERRHTRYGRTGSGSSPDGELVARSADREVPGRWPGSARRTGRVPVDFAASAVQSMFLRA